MAMPIYTRGGDRGETGLVDGQRVKKNHPRIEALGVIDETTSWVGAAAAQLLTHNSEQAAKLRSALIFLQHRLYNCSAQLARPPAESSITSSQAAQTEQVLVSTADVEMLEQLIDQMMSSCAPLKHFILPGGSITASWLHVARAICRRAERRVLSLAATEIVEADNLLSFLNRAADFLFAAARFANLLDAQEEPKWDKNFSFTL